MAKKIISAIAVALLTVGFVFAQDAENTKKEKKPSALSLSAGVGGFLDITDFSTSVDGTKSDDKTRPYVGGGVALFFDATYVEASIDMLFNSTQEQNKFKAGMTYFGFSLLGKYPIAIGQKAKIFPLLGIDYQLILSSQLYYDGEAKGDPTSRSDMPDDKDAWASVDNFDIVLGVGADIDLTSKLYLRPEFLFGIKVNYPEAPDKVTYFGDDIRLKIALGYKF